MEIMLERAIEDQFLLANLNQVNQDQFMIQLTLKEVQNFIHFHLVHKWINLWKEVWISKMILHLVQARELQEEKANLNKFQNQGNQFQSMIRFGIEVMDLEWMQTQMHLFSQFWSLVEQCQ